MQPSIELTIEDKIHPFICKICDYKCTKINHWERHIKTKKHLSQLNMKSINTGLTNEYECECGKTFKFRQGLHVHRKKCFSESVKKNAKKDTNNPTINVDYVMELIKQNKEMQQLLIEQTHILQEQSNKVLELTKDNKTNNLYQNSFNTTNNNQFNLQIFLNETCKDAINLTDFVESLQITVQDLENTARLGYAEGISQIFINGLKELNVNSRPIHCSDSKRNILHIREQDIWLKDDDEQSRLKSAIRVIGKKNISQIAEWQKANPDFSNPESRQNDRYLKMLCNVMSGSTVEEQQKNLNKIAKNVTKEVTIDKNNFNNNFLK